MLTEKPSECKRKTEDCEQGLEGAQSVLFANQPSLVPTRQPSYRSRKRPEMFGPPASVRFGISKPTHCPVAFDFVVFVVDFVDFVIVICSGGRTPPSPVCACFRSLDLFVDFEVFFCPVSD